MAKYLLDKIDPIFLTQCNDAQHTEVLLFQVTTIDRQVAKLYEEGARKPRSSDSSRRTRFSNRRSAAGAGNIKMAPILYEGFSIMLQIQRNNNNI